MRLWAATETLGCNRDMSQVTAQSLACMVETCIQILMHAEFFIALVQD